jgi:hypothetical protein
MYPSRANIVGNSNTNNMTTKRRKAYHYNHRTGEKVVAEFYSNYKDIEKSIERNEHTK